MLIGVVGKSNVGKSTFFSAATLVDAEISNRIFTTIEPNKGVSYVRVPCPCKSLGITCNPRNSKCVNGTRFVPVKLVDIAGLVPGAHEGKGLGNQFLSDIMEANALIHVVDMAGATDESGNPVPPGTRDPKEDIKFLEEEIDYWILGIVKRNLATLSKRMDATKEKFSEILYKQLSGLGIKMSEVEDAINRSSVGPHSDDYDLMKFIALLRSKSKPIVLAANKMDLPSADRNFERLTDLGYHSYPCCAEYELVLRKAAEHGIVNYNPGDHDFTILNANEKQKEVLEKVRKFVHSNKGTGVQNIIDTAVFDILGMIVVYPVENEHKFSDKKGNVLPDAFLIKKGATARDLAYLVHEDIGKNFIAAMDARSKRNVSANYELKNGDVISIKAGR
jgi:ribosome-binding ATPase YchF (GTP1/OBG family)